MPNVLQHYYLLWTSDSLVAEPKGSVPLIPHPTVGHDSESVPCLSCSHSLLHTLLFSSCVLSDLPSGTAACDVLSWRCKRQSSNTDGSCDVSIFNKQLQTDGWGNPSTLRMGVGLTALYTIQCFASQNFYKGHRIELMNEKNNHKNCWSVWENLIFIKMLNVYPKLWSYLYPSFEGCAEKLIIWGCIQKFPDWVDNEINNIKHSRSNTKSYGGKTR
jgi:hypothetical protein